MTPTAGVDEAMKDHPVPSSGLSAARVEEIEARANAAMPGPWDWFGNVKVNNVYLATQKFGRRFVLQFWRWGMHSAQPAFQTDHRMVTLEEMSEAGHVVTDHNGAILRINHPDAEFIAHARTDIPDLLAEVRRLQGELAAAREETAQAVREFKTLKLAVCLDEKAVNDRIRDRYFELLDDPARVDGEYGRYEVLREYGFVRCRSLPGETADA